MSSYRLISSSVSSSKKTSRGSTPGGITASFIGVPLYGTVPLSVTFTDQSTGSPTSWYWDFGDGTTSTSQNPTHVYTTVGVYSVSLTVSNLTSADTFTRTSYVTATTNSSSVASFTLNSPTTNPGAQFSIGHSFKQGDIPSGAVPVIDGADAQSVIKNTWPDGSAKFAVISGTANLVSNTDLTVSISAGIDPGGSPLTTSDLQTTGVVATVGCGIYGTVTWTGTDWATPFQTWISGPKMSSWIYRKPVGSDTSLVAWIEVKLYKDGSVETLPWIENGYMFISTTDKAEVFTYTLNGVQRFSQSIDLKYHQRTVLINGTMLSHWTVNDPLVLPTLDKNYFQSTEMVPSYIGVVDPTQPGNVVVGNPAHPGLVTTYSPLQQGNFDYDGSQDNMPASGYQPPIGLLPQHDMLYLVTDATVCYGAIIRNGFSAGRYGIHYRDENTNLPPRFSDYPTLVFADGQGFKDTGASTTSTYTAVSTGGSPPPWDTAHCPSVGYMAYLLSGLFYFKEECQFAAISNHFNVTDWVRGGGLNYAPYPGYTGASGIAVSYPQTRTGSWLFRTLVQALAITPDSGDPLRQELINSVTDNCNYFYQIYIAQPNNIFGFIAGGNDYGSYPGVDSEPIWQQDFGTAAWGWARSLGLPLSSSTATKLDSFFRWKARSIIGRLGTQEDFWYINGAPYLVSIGSVSSPDFINGTGPWFNSWAETYQASPAASGTGGGQGSVDGVLALDYPAASQPSMWHNLQPAISYAVRHGVSGAKAGYDRMTGASNWSQILDVWNTKPVWGIKPAYIPDVATTLVLSGSLTGKIGTSTTVTVGTDLPRTEPITVTLSVDGCTVTPSSSVLDIGNSTVNFIVTPSGDTGTRSITTTNTGLLNNATGNFTIVSSLPQWKIGKPINSWFQLPGTSVRATGARADVYSGMARRGTECVVAAAGGHTDSSDNRVVKIDLGNDSPAWSMLHAPSTNIVPDQPYYPDGRPVSRHTYWASNYCQPLDKVMMIGCQFGYQSATTYPTVDAFDIDTGLWDGIVPDAPGINGSGYDNIINGQYGQFADSRGDIWTMGAFSIAKWDHVTKTQSFTATNLPYPAATSFGCWDTTRDRGVTIGFGNGSDNGTDLRAYIFPADGTSRTPITLSGPGLNDFLAEHGTQAGITYDSKRDKIYWYSGYATAGKFYVIDPATWNISVFPLASGSSPPTPSIGGSAPFSKFQYVPELDCIVYVDANSGANISILLLG